MDLRRKADTFLTFMLRTDWPKLAKRWFWFGCDWVAESWMRLLQMRRGDWILLARRVDVRKPVHAAIIGAIIATIMAPVLNAWATNARYVLGAQEVKVMTKPAPDLQNKLKYYAKDQANIFNQTAQGGADPTQGFEQTQGGGKDQLYTATLPDDPSQGIAVHDNVNDVTVSFTPQTGLMGGRAVDHHVVYPLKDQNGSMVFTPKANGMKEDIVLASAPNGDTATYHYQLDVPDYVQPRLEEDGSIGFYTADQEFFGNISYGSDKDRAAVDKARVNDAKDYLMFDIPAPVVRQTNQKKPVVARFSLDGTDLSVFVSGLSHAGYPLSVDPTFLLSSTGDWVLGSIDDNIDLSVANQVGRQPLVGGSTPTWTPNSAPNLAYANFASSLVAYNGFLYMFGGGSGGVGGGGTSGTTTNDVRYISLDPTTGALGGTTPTTWTQTSLLGTARQGLVAWGFNGYLYVAGGEDNSEAPITVASGHTTEYAKINSDGTVGAWAYGTSLNTARSYPAATIYQGTLYVLGGTSATNNATPTATIEYSKINGDGTMGSWTQSTTTSNGSMSSARSKFRAGAYNGFVYVTGGQTSSTTVINNVEYAAIQSDGSLGPWTSTTAFPTARRDHGMTIENGYIYVFGGCTGAAEPCAGFLGDTQYAVINADGTIGQWQSTVPYNTGGFNSRMPAGVTAYSNHLYFVGGCSAETATNNCATQLVGTFITSIDGVGRYDRGVDTVQTTAPFNNNGLTETKDGGSSAALNGSLYYLGGCNTSGCATYDSVVEKATLNADGSTGSWSTTTALPAGSGDGAGRMGATVVAYNNKLYVIGGTERKSSITFPSPSAAPTGSTFTTASTTHNVSMPATVNAGDLLICIFSHGGNVTDTTPTGWSGGAGITGWSLEQGTTIRGSVFVKSAAGTEGGTTVNFVTSGTAVGAAQVYRIPSGSWYGSLSNVTEAVAVASAGAAATTTPDPPALTPTWGSDDNLWLAVSTGNVATSVTTYPTNYSSGVITTNASATDVASAQRGLTAASENPGTFTMGQSAINVNFTIAVRPAEGTNNVLMTTILSDTQNSDGTLGASWTTETNSLPAGRAFGQAVVWHNWIYYLGGLSSLAAATAASTNVYHAQITSNAPGTWSTTTTQLSQARWAHSVGIWGNWIYVVGGLSDTAGTFVSGSNAIEQLTIANSGDITAASSGQNPTGQFSTYGMGGFVHNGIIYTMGGYTSGSTAAVGTINWASLDSSTGAVGTWSNTNIGNRGDLTAGLSTARGLTTATDTGGNFYTMGGCTSTLDLTTFRGCTAFVSTAQSIEVNLPNNGGTGQMNTFANATNTLPTATSDQAVLAYNGFLYSIGGCTAYTSGSCSTTVTRVEAAPINTDGSVGTWTTTGMTALPSAVSLEQAVAYNNYIYVVGGRGASNAVTTVWYAPISSTGTIGTWVDVSGNYLPAARMDFGMAIARGYMYVAGGIDSGGTRQNGLYYTQINTSDGSLVQPTGSGCSSTWCSSALTSFTTARSSFNLLSYNGDLYVVGGYDGSNNLTDIQYAATSSSDGSISSWNYATDVARGQKFRQAIAANGYMYFIGNETDSTEAQYVDINANGTLGLVQDSVAATNSTQIHGAVAYSNGHFYLVGGCTVSSGVCTTPATTVETSGQLAIARVGHYSKLFNTQVNTSPSQLQVQGALSGPGSSVNLSFFTEATGASSFGVAQVFDPVIFGNFYRVQALDSGGNNVGIAFNYLIILSLDDSNSGTFPDVVSANDTAVQDITLYYHANPGRRLRHGASFSNTGCNPVPQNGCILDTAP